MQQKYDRRWIAVAVAALLIAVTAAPTIGFGADHLDAPGLTSPGGDGALDINDIFAFEGEDDSNTVLVMTTNPAAGALSSVLYSTSADYYINVDTDGDAVADKIARFTFDGGEGGQTVSMYWTTDGAETLVASGNTNSTIPIDGGGQLFTGLRSDPFFFDLGGFRGTVEGDEGGRGLGDGNATDPFADFNTNAIVIELPDAALGENIGVWGATTLDGTQIDRMGRPAINTVVNSSGPLVQAPSENKNIFNASEPKDDVANFTDAVVTALQTYSSLDSEGAYADEQAAALAGVLLPDVLTYDTSTEAVGPLNGRTLTDDVIDIELRIVTGGDPLGLFEDRDADGAINTDDIGPHDDLLSTFPYLGEPHEAEPELDDIVDTAIAAGTFDTLVTAVQAAGLEDTLRGAGPFTVLAPTDAAFAALGTDTINALLADPDTLADILLYHVISGAAVTSDVVVTLDSATMANGDDITIEVVDGQVVINGVATVTTVDIMASNGVIHVIDAVLLPPTEAPDEDLYDVTVKIENLAPMSGNFLTPVWVGFHDGSFDLYNLGEAASAELERLAEDGNTGPLSDAFQSAGAGSTDATLPGPNGPIAPNDVLMHTFTLDAADPADRYLSMASMVIPSNDAFVANGDPVAHPIFDESGAVVAVDFFVVGADVRDAGTEVNDELPANTAFFGQAAPDTGDAEDGVVSAHPGFNAVGSGGILDDAMFSGADFTVAGYPIAKVSFTVEKAEAPPEGPTLQVGSNADRSAGSDLEGSSVSGKVFVWVDPLFPEDMDDVKTVDFLIDGKLRHTEYRAPYDMIAGATDVATRPWDTSEVSNGEHTVTAVANFRDGTKAEISATFTVAN
ncbi:MAG: DUF4331 family protein [Acidimicrobiia bacterium]|nr:DUF4331 family protein [Acidimicrobiia bacterium]